MRLALLADVHGNLVALDACLADLRAHGGADAIVVAGDLCADGPRPREVLERLAEIGAICVRGNTDRELADREAFPDGDADDETSWFREKLGETWLRWLLALPFSRTFDGGDAGGLLVMHANPLTDDDHLRPDASDELLERCTAGVAERTLAFGHLHYPYVRHWRDFMLVDVSSAGLPKDGDAMGNYAILTARSGGWSVRMRRVPFDVESVARDLERRGVPNLKKRLTVLRRHAYKDLDTLR